MRFYLILALSAVSFPGAVWADEQPRQAPNVILQSPDGKKSYDLGKLVAEGPVLVRLTCACTGCDEELPYFQKLQSAYDAQGLKTLAVFREKPETASNYAAKKDIRFLWLEDPKGALWKTFDATVMPTNILIAKGGRVVKVVPGCAKDGKNARILSAEIARLLNVPEVKIAEGRTVTK